MVKAKWKQLRVIGYEKPPAKTRLFSRTRATEEITLPTAYMVEIIESLMVAGRSWRVEGS